MSVSLVAGSAAVGADVMRVPETQPYHECVFVCEVQLGQHVGVNALAQDIEITKLPEKLI